MWTTKMWSIIYCIKNKPSKAVLLYSVSDGDNRVEDINEYMRCIYDDYDQDCSQYWNKDDFPNVPASKQVTFEFCEVYTVSPTDINNKYIKLLKNYDMHIMTRDHIDIWIIETGTEINMMNIINDIKLVNADRKDV
jgi:hypothetical protein